VDDVGWALAKPSLCEINGSPALSYQAEREDGSYVLRFAILR